MKDRVVRAVFAVTLFLVNCGFAFAQSWSYENKLLTGADGIVLNASLSGTEVKVTGVSKANGLTAIDLRGQVTGPNGESYTIVEATTVAKYATVQTEGVRQVTRTLEYYSLEAIIAVGYRVNSRRATDFRRWATRVLRDFAIRGYVLDKERLENGKFLGEDYFDRLIEEIQAIRLGERRFYQKITDIYATSMDYDKDAEETRIFFAKVQNKLHYAVHGQTAAELIWARADAGRDNMGLTTGTIMWCRASRSTHSGPRWTEMPRCVCGRSIRLPTASWASASSLPLTSPISSEPRPRENKDRSNHATRADR